MLFFARMFYELLTLGKQDESKKNVLDEVEENIFDDGKIKKKFITIQSSPIVVLLKNITDDVLENIELLYPFRFFEYELFSNGSISRDGYIIKSLYDSITYREILASIFSSPMRMGFLRVNTNKGEFNKRLIYYSGKDIDGHQYFQPFTLKIEDEQFQKSIVDCNFECVFDTLASIKLERLEPKEELQFTFYPAERMNHIKN